MKKKIAIIFLISISSLSLDAGEQKPEDISRQAGIGYSIYFPEGLGNILSTYSRGYDFASKLINSGFELYNIEKNKDLSVNNRTYFHK